jgi:hypothetical protein
VRDVFWKTLNIQGPSLRPRVATFAVPSAVHELKPPGFGGHGSSIISGHPVTL